MTTGNEMNETFTADDLFTNPSEVSIKDFYKALWWADVKQVEYMLKGGFPPNELPPSLGVGMHDNRNAALYVLDVKESLEMLEIVNLLVDYGIDINHQGDDSQEVNLWCFLLDAVTSYEYEEDKRVAQLDSKFELPFLLELRKTFNRVMMLKLERKDFTAEELRIVFEHAYKCGAVHWIEALLDKMSEEEVSLYKQYRLAALFEV